MMTQLRFTVMLALPRIFTSIFSKTDWAVAQMTPKKGVFRLCARMSKVFRVIVKQAARLLESGRGSGGILGAGCSR
jgi:long-subunit acyl-CoA synthetase (AMP-forming)